MVVTGGSDFHGESEKIGTSLGLIGTGFEVGSELLKNLKKAARYKR